MRRHRPPIGQLGGPRRQRHRLRPSAGFDLPNGSNRSPDAAWILVSRLQALSKEDLDEYPPLCPDFVVEVRSKSDRLSTLKEKMAEYMDNGARLGWLIDPVDRQVWVYRPSQPVELLREPATLGADPELAGFLLDLHNLWHPKVWPR